MLVSSFGKVRTQLAMKGENETQDNIDNQESWISCCFVKVRGPAVRHALEMSSNIATLECNWIYPSDVLVWLIVLEKSICELWLWLGLGILAEFIYAIFHYYNFFSAVQMHKNIFFCFVGSCPLQVLKTGDLAGENHDGAQIGAIDFFNKLGERHKNKPGEFQYETREKNRLHQKAKTRKTQRTEKNRKQSDVPRKTNCEETCLSRNKTEKNRRLPKEMDFFRCFEHHQWSTHIDIAVTGSCKTILLLPTNPTKNDVGALLFVLVVRC